MFENTLKIFFGLSFFLTLWLGIGYLLYWLDENGYHLVAYFLRVVGILFLISFSIAFCIEATQHLPSSAAVQFPR